MQLIIIITLGVTVIMVAPFLFKVHIYVDRKQTSIKGSFACLMYGMGCSVAYADETIAVSYGKKTKSIRIEEFKKFKKKDSSSLLSIDDIRKYKIKSIDITMGISEDIMYYMPQLTAANVMLGVIMDSMQTPTIADINLCRLQDKGAECLDIKCQIRCNFFIILSTLINILLKGTKAQRSKNERS